MKKFILSFIFLSMVSLSNAQEMGTLIPKEEIKDCIGDSSTIKMYKAGIAAFWDGNITFARYALDQAAQDEKTSCYYASARVLLRRISPFCLELDTFPRLESSYQEIIKDFPTNKELGIVADFSMKDYLKESWAARDKTAIQELTSLSLDYPEFNIAKNMLIQLEMERGYLFSAGILLKVELIFSSEDNKTLMQAGVLFAKLGFFEDAVKYLKSVKEPSDEISLLLEKVKLQIQSEETK